MNEEMPDFSPEVEKKIIISIENLDPDMFQANLKSLLLQDRSQSVISFVFLTSRILFLLCSVAQKYDADTSDIQSFLWQNQQGVWEWNTPSKALQSLTEMARDVMKEVQKMRMSNGSHIVEGVRCYLEKNYAYDISLATLSKQFHINGAYLSEIFKQHVGETFSDYLMRLRLNKARDLLREPYMKITDIALLCGFSNPSYFSTVFKKHFGQTPIEFRKGRMLHDSGE